MASLRARIERLDVFTPADTRSAIFDEVIEGRDPELVDLLLDQIGGYLHDDEARRVLELVRDRDVSPEVRAHGAIGLGPALELWELERDDPMPLGDPSIDPDLAHEIHEALLSIVGDTDEPKIVRRRALEAAVRCFDERHDDLVRRFWNDSDPEWQLTALFAMGQATDYEDEVLAAVNDASLDPAVRAEAFRSAGRLNLTTATGKARGIAADASKPDELRYGAMLAYAQLSPLEAPDLLERIAEEEDGEIHDLAMILLEELEEGPLTDDW